MGLIAVGDVSGSSNYDFLSLDSNNVNFVSRESSSLTIHTMDHNLQVQNSFVIPIANANNFWVAYNETHVSVARTLGLFDGTDIQYRDYSMLSNVSVDLNRTDIGITHLTITDLSRTTDPINTGVCQLLVCGSAMVTSFGTDTLHSCIVNN